MGARLAGTSPPVTIGMPVYNGGNYLEQALKSLLTQTEGDFRLVVSDNGSTDQTQVTCRDFAAADPRVTYIRHEANRGAAWNFNHVAGLATSTFFMWAAADDLWEPLFLERCLKRLREQQEAIVAFSALQLINPNNDVLQPYVVPPEEVSSPDVAERVAAVFRLRTFSHVYGLMRRAVLVKTRQFQPVWGPDQRLLLELSLRGPVAIVPEVLYSNRVYAHKTFDAMAIDLTGRAQVIRVENATSELLGGLIRQVLTGPLTLRQKAAIIARVATSIYDSDLAWRGGLSAELARSMRSAYEARRFLRLTTGFLLRSILDPRTPALAMQRWLSSPRDPLPDALGQAAQGQRGHSAVSHRTGRRSPLVSIGMPVRNGEPFLANAITSLLNQEFEDFELVISDNDSHDATADICRSFARSDKRVSYRRMPDNIGVTANFNHVLSSAKTPYFMWAAHDDHWDPRYLAGCLDRLQEEPAAVSCATEVELIDRSNHRIGPIQSGPGLTSPHWATRVATIVARHDGYVGFGFYGLHRTEALRSVSPLEEGFGADVLLTLRLAKLGRWGWIAEPLFRYRVYPKEGDGEFAWLPGFHGEERPVSRLMATVWEEIGSGPRLHERVTARSRFALAAMRPGGGWNRFLLKENGNLLRSAVAQRDVLAVVRHGSKRLLLDPLSPLRRRNWDIVAEARRATVNDEWGTAA
jgi:glycosyltransferase involved in cell wall biosynthesis